MTITGIPSTRVSDQLVQQRLLAQLRNDQTAVFAAESAISTGKRFTVPSENSSAALRAISLQMLIERKEQVKTNLITNQSFLSASDSSISEVSGILADIRGAAISVLGSSNSSEARLAVSQQVDRAIQQLVDTGNQQFRGRYLFAGSQTTLQPFENNGPTVGYLGDENRLLSYSALDVLFATNITGDQVFGALSSGVRGTADLNPILTPNTRLSDLRGGLGVRKASISLSSGTATSVIDISGAETIGDVARLLETNPPAGSQVTAFVTTTGLSIQLDVGNLTIREVAGGTTVAELGILTETGVGTAPVLGTDLNPTLRLTTPLDNILGTRAGVRIVSTDADGTFQIVADRNGSALNGVTVTLVGGGMAGAEMVVYDTMANTITVTVENTVSTAQNVIDAINASAAAVDFTAGLVLGEDGTGVVLLGVNTTAGGGGVQFDRTSGLRIENGGQTHVITFTNATTVEDVLNTLNGSTAGVVASINDARTGIDIRTRLSGGDFSIGETGGTTAKELGVRSFTTATKLEDLNHGIGVQSAQGTDFTVRRKDGVLLPIDLTAGLQAIVTLDGAAANDALEFRSLQPGTAGNNFQVQFTDSGVGGGDAVALVGNVLTFNVDIAAGFTALEAISLLQADATLSVVFSAALDGSADPNNTGGSNLAVGGPVSLAGGAGSAQTIDDVLYLINTHANNVAAGEKLVARLATVGNGIELVHDNLNAQLTITVTAAIGSQAAEDLGFVGFQGSQSAAPVAGIKATVLLNGADPNDALLFRVLRLGTGGNVFQVEITDSGAGGGDSLALVGNLLTFNVDIAAGFTAQEAVTLLNNDLALSPRFSAQLSTTADPGNTGAGNLVVTAAANFSGGTSEILTGADVNPLEARGAFNALIRLREALAADNVIEITRSINLLDVASSQTNFARAELGARQQALDILEDRLDVERIELEATLSLEQDVDLIEAISTLTARQASLEASLRTLAATARLTLLNFL